MSTAHGLRASLGFLALIVAAGTGQPGLSQEQTDAAAAPAPAAVVVQPTGTDAAAGASPAGSAPEAPPPAAAEAQAPAEAAAAEQAPQPSGDAAAADPAADPALAAAIETGKTEYLKNCRACHGSKGTAGVPLAGNYKVEGGFGYLGWAILTGPGYMPEFAEALTDEQVAQICTYILNSWGNAYGIVTAEDIASIR